MKRRNDKMDIGSTISKIFLSLIFLFLSAVLVISIMRIEKKYSFVKEGRNDLQNEIQEIESSIDSLSESLEYLETPGGTQRALRQQFRVTSEGEELIIIVPDNL